MEHHAEVPDSPALQAYKADQPQRIDRTQDRLRADLLSLNVITVVAEYDGCGDSGQFEEIHYYDAEQQDVTARVGPNISDDVEALLHDLLEGRHGGWENNDGGCGTFTWDLKEQRLEHDHKDRYTAYDCTYHEGFDDNEPVSTGDAQ